MSIAPRLTIAVFPGHFDPITRGHVDVVKRAVNMFDQIIVAVGVNPEKREMFTLPERLEMARSVLKDLPSVKVSSYEGLTVDFVTQSKAVAILRGIRDSSDLRYETQLAMANRAVGGVETIFILAGEEFALTSSSLIRQVVALGGDVRKLQSVLPPVVIEQLIIKQKQGHFKSGPDAQ